MQNNDLELMSLQELKAHIEAILIRDEAKRNMATWLVLVWDLPELNRRIYQIDMVDAQGRNAGSTSPKELASQGVILPDFSHLPNGNYRFSDIIKA